MKIKTYKWKDLDVYYQYIQTYSDGTEEFYVIREISPTGEDLKGSIFKIKDKNYFYKNVKEVEIDYFEIFK